jgi:hypothetical protein
MQEKTLKKIITLLKKRYKLHSHRKFGKNFKIQKPKSQAKIEDKQKIMTHLESVHLHLTPTRKVV